MKMLWTLIKKLITKNNYIRKFIKIKDKSKNS